MPKDEIKTESLTSPAPALTPGEDRAPEAGKPAKFDWKKIFGRKKKPIGEIDLFKAIKYIYPLTIAIIVLILIWVMSFLYNNVYLTMSQAEIVSSLKSKVIEESVDFSKFTEIVGEIDAKKALSAWPYLKYPSSPFSYGARLSYPETPIISRDQATSTAVNAAATTTSTSTAR